MRDAPTVQPYRTATAASAITAVVTILLCVTSPANSAASSAVTALIIAMFAHSEHHCSATLPAIYFLLSGTATMSRLLIIIRPYPPPFRKQKMQETQVYEGQYASFSPFG